MNANHDSTPMAWPSKTYGPGESRASRARIPPTEVWRIIRVYSRLFAVEIL